MQQQAAAAYQQTAKKTASPRELEASLLSKSAAQLQRIKDDWDNKKSELDGALTYNRKLWTVFLTSVTKDENPLPVAIKQNVANLGIFVMNQTIQILANPAPEKLTVMININQELAAGLRTQMQQAAE
ncbi:flagellar biosynthesis regulator FlaF [Maritalea porphyrae]|jgi:flagellar protein FlaF|uniref:flagellar biosynthesis regulator FlaF n=1 Tax=Maritalea porphyrae TaxID=880732 RepID=UPI0022AEDB30|nr:flagellar biosynthesis regulator FlaF [Maritalea porphyrae]MCZ4272687.1 flagellar biosynthesis regulator FlaF [Maritalea porphyrae]